MVSIQVTDYNLIDADRMIELHSTSATSYAGTNADLTRANIHAYLAVTGSGGGSQIVDVQFDNVEILWTKQHKESPTHFTQSIGIAYPFVNRGNIKADNIKIRLIDIYQIDFREKDLVEKYIDFRDTKF
jgi:hypothetical protein